MLNFSIREALKLKTTSLTKLYRTLYPKLKSSWAYCSMYHAAAYKTASSIIRSWRRGRRARPVATRLFVRLHRGLYKLEENQLSLTIRPGQRVSIELVVGEYQRQFLRAHRRGELTVGEAVLSERCITVPFIKEVNSAARPSSAIAVDLNEDCAVLTDEGGRTRWLDLRLVRTIHTEYFKKHRRIQQKVKSEAARAALLAKYGLRERRRVEAVLHEVAKAVVQLAEQRGSAILLEDLRGLGNRVRFSRMLNRRLRIWNYRKLQAFIQYKALWAGLLVVYLPARGTSKLCSRCGGLISPKERACPACGLDRHVNACLNLLGMWGGALAPKASEKRK
jgi:IS605 OrfB family transposase